MAGNSNGGKAAAATNKLRHGSDFYKKIGSKGGLTIPSSPRGFAALSLERRREIGAMGGAKSRRTK